MLGHSVKGVVEVTGLTMIIAVFYKVETSFRHLYIHIALLRMNNIFTKAKFDTFFFFNLIVETFKILNTYNKSTPRQNTAQSSCVPRNIQRYVSVNKQNNILNLPVNYVGTTCLSVPLKER
jgi:hypothetical protein